jgi:hypothetical protein
LEKKGGERDTDQKILKSENASEQSNGQVANENILEFPPQSGESD